MTVQKCNDPQRNEPTYIYLTAQFQAINKFSYRAFAYFDTSLKNIFMLHFVMHVLCSFVIVNQKI